MKKSEQINCVTPLLEENMTLLLASMLVKKPYTAPREKDEKKKWKKKIQDGLWSKGPPDTRSEEMLEGEEEDKAEEVSDSSYTKKRVASEDDEGDHALVPSKKPRRAPIALLEDIPVSDEESMNEAHAPRRILRVNP